MAFSLCCSRPRVVDSRGGWSYDRLNRSTINSSNDQQIEGDDGRAVVAMPSIRKRVYGLIRTTFSPSQSIDEDAYEATAAVAISPSQSASPIDDVFKPSLGSPTGEHSFIYHYLTGRLKRLQQPEIYYGKTGVDLPVIQLEAFSSKVCASYTGPDGGLTEVPSVKKRPIASIANLDDELSLSFDGESVNEATFSGASHDRPKRLEESAYGCGALSCSSLISSGFDTMQHRTCHQFDWTKWDERAYGHSMSLYEKHPFTGVHAGNPVADVFGLVARENCCILALADGVNWGDRARLAARCAIRGAIDHLNENLMDGNCKTTLDVFHTLLGAFHAGHQLILQEGGTLTTLCVVVIAKIRDSNAWVVCACNVGDSLCFIYNKTLGVREVTLGSHDICQMRDMRDAGGALGPVDGVNPELQNLTCSMTFVDDDDLVFITSDGVSDNFDPVVGKFCVIKKSSSPSPANKENSTIQPPAAKEKPTSQGSTKNGHARPKPGAHPERMNSCNSEADDGGFNQKVSVHLPVVDGMQRHDLMLLRMEDMLTHGVTIGDPSACTAKDLCQNLVNFAHQLSMAKRRTLEDPDLYQGEKQLSRSDQRTRRKMVRNKIAEMPGKLDHATVVAYKVGVWPTSEVEDEEEYAQELGGDVTPMPERRQVDSQMTDASTPNGDDAESVQTPVDPPCCETNIDETFVLDSFTVCSAEVTLTDAFSPSKDPYLMAAFAEERVRMIDEMSHSSSITTGEMRMLSLEASPLLDAHPFPVDTVVEPSSTENDQFDEEGTIVPASNGYDSLLPQPDNTTCSQSLTIDDEHTTAPSSEYDIPPIKANNLEPDETITNLAAQLQTVEPDNQFNTDNNMLNRPTQLKIKPGSDVDETDVDEQISWTERSPYEALPTLPPPPPVVTGRPPLPTRKKKHERGSAARHTLSVDVGWLKRLVSSKSEQKDKADAQDRSSLMSPRRSSVGFKERLRGLGASLSIRSSQRQLPATPECEQLPSSSPLDSGVVTASKACAPRSPSLNHSASYTHIASANGGKVHTAI